MGAQIPEIPDDFGKGGRGLTDDLREYLELIRLSCVGAGAQTSRKLYDKPHDNDTRVQVNADGVRTVFYTEEPCVESTLVILHLASALQSTLYTVTEATGKVEFADAPFGEVGNERAMEAMYRQLWTE